MALLKAGDKITVGSPSPLLDGWSGTALVISTQKQASDPVWFVKQIPAPPAGPWPALGVALATQVAKFKLVGGADVLDLPANGGSGAGRGVGNADDREAAV